MSLTPVEGDEQHTADEHQGVQGARRRADSAQEVVQLGQVDHEGHGVDRRQVRGDQHRVPVILQLAGLGGGVVLVDGQARRERRFGQQRDDEDDARGPGTPVPNAGCPSRGHPQILARRIAPGKRRCGARYPERGKSDLDCSVGSRESWSIGQMEGDPAAAISSAMVCANASGRERNG